VFDFNSFSLPRGRVDYPAAGCLPFLHYLALTGLLGWSSTLTRMRSRLASLVLIGWIATLSFFIGSTTQRVQNLEQQVSQMVQSINTMMQTSIATEKFNNIQNRTDSIEKHLEYDDKRLDTIQNRVK
jgi:hypothetical protein